MVDMQVDDEVLFQYALALGMHENSAAQARLAQIADFVEANPHAHSAGGKADAAMELGLHEGDLIVRRILADSGEAADPQRRAGAEADARRSSSSSTPRTARSTCGRRASASRRWRSTASCGRTRRRGRARCWRRFGEGNLDLEAALRLADETPARVHFELLTEQGLQSELGGDFASAVMALRPGSWSEPIPSDYGHHLVWVHEYQAPSVEPLAAVREQVEQAVLQKLADDWLALRLRELRTEFDVVVPGRES